MSNSQTIEVGDICKIINNHVFLTEVIVCICKVDLYERVEFKVLKCSFEALQNKYIKVDQGWRLKDFELMSKCGEAFEILNI